VYKFTEISIAGTEIAVTGRIFQTARLRHEWFEFVTNPVDLVKNLKKGGLKADLFTFVDTIRGIYGDLPFYKQTDSMSILTVRSYTEWWEGLHFKVRNKIRKAQKSGVELRPVPLDDELAKGVEAIYNESPIRQGMKFWHYGKTAAVIKQDLSSFPECTSFIGAYYQGELIGFVKLFEGDKILRTVHIIAKLSHRDKPVQDALIAKAVEICAEKQIPHLHYGAWSRGGLGVFKIKHGFQRFDVSRYFVPLTQYGRCILGLRLHRPGRDYLPESWVPGLLTVRAKWNSWRYNQLANQT
jgi:hypothetical protein